MALCLAAAATACAAPAAAPPAPGPATSTAIPLPPDVDDGSTARAAAVTGLLTRWGDAARRGDADALAALADPAADPGFVTAERARAGVLATVPFTELTYVLGGDPAPVVDPALVRALDADEVWAPPVELRYALAGADPRPTSRPVGLVVARRGDTWALVSDTAVADRGRATWRGPWDFGPLVVRAGSAGGVVLGHPAQAAAVAELGAELDTAVPAVTDAWGPGWAQQAAVWVAGSDAELTALVGSPVPATSAAVTTADAVDRGAGTATGQRVVVNPAVLDRLTPAAARVLLRHELTHVATAAVATGSGPRWLLEGYADHVGYRGSGTTVAQGAPTVAALVRANGPPDQLPTDLELAAGPGVAVAQQLAWTFARFLAETRGEDVLRAVFRAVAPLATPTEPELDAALEPVLGEGAAGARAQWGRWLVAAVGG